VSYGPEWKTPQDFGAVGDGSTDDRAAFQSAADSGWPIYVPWTPGGYVLGHRVRLQSGAALEFSTKSPSLKLNSNDWLFEVVGSDVKLTGFRADLSHLASGGGILLRTDQSHLERVLIEDIILSAATNAVMDMASPTYRAVLLTLKNIIAYGLRGSGIMLQRSFAYQHCEKLTMLPVASNLQPAFYSIGNEGSFWRQCDATGGSVHVGNTSALGFGFVNCKAVWIEQCMADMVGGSGFAFNGCEYVYGNQLISSMVGAIGIAVNNSSKVTLSSCNVGGRSGMPYSPAHPGFAVSDSPGTIIDDACRAYASSGLPVSVVSSSGTRNNVMVN
jgi:hypothetical protein